MSDPDESASAESLYVRYLADLEAGRASSLEDLCSIHPDKAQELRDLEAARLAFGDIEPGLGLDPVSQVRVVPPETPRSRADVRAVLEELAGQTPARWPYRLVREIGRGTFGIVHEAEDSVLRRRVALKVLRTREGGSDPERIDLSRLARFVEEARILAQLDHPAIPPLLAMGLDPDGRPYFAMGLVRGESLAVVLSRFREGRGWPLVRVVEALSTVCEALAYGHARGIVHRDVKPDNIRVGEYGKTYLLDWGLARSRSGERDSDATDPRRLPDRTPDPSDLDEVAVGIDAVDRRTLQGTVIGTPAYMSPEQAMGRSEVVGPASDVYAVGAILFEVLAGQAPYRRSNDSVAPARHLTRVVEGGLPSVRDLAPSAPPELAAICDKALARDVGSRYADAALLGSDLRAFLEQRVVHAYETGAFAELRKWARRNRGVATGAIAALLLVGLLLVALFSSQRRELSASRDLLSTQKDLFLNQVVAQSEELYLSELGSLVEFTEGVPSVHALLKLLSDMGYQGWEFDYHRELASIPWMVDGPTRYRVGSHGGSMVTGVLDELGRLRALELEGVGPLSSGTLDDWVWLALEGGRGLGLTSSGEFWFLELRERGRARPDLVRTRACRSSFLAEVLEQAGIQSFQDAQDRKRPVRLAWLPTAGTVLVQGLDKRPQLHVLDLGTGGLVRTHEKVRLWAPVQASGYVLARGERLEWVDPSGESSVVDLEDEVTALGSGFDTRAVVVGCFSGGVHLWRPGAGEPPQLLGEYGPFEPEAAWLTPDERFAVTRHDDECVVWDTRSPAIRSIVEVPMELAPVDGVAVSLEARRLGFEPPVLLTTRLESRPRGSLGVLVPTTGVLPLWEISGVPSGVVTFEGRPLDVQGDLLCAVSSPTMLEREHLYVLSLRDGTLLDQAGLDRGGAAGVRIDASRTRALVWNRQGQVRVRDLGARAWLQGWSSLGGEVLDVAAGADAGEWWVSVKGRGVLRWIGESIGPAWPQRPSEEILRLARFPGSGEFLVISDSGRVERRSRTGAVSRSWTVPEDLGAGSPREISISPSGRWVSVALEYRGLVLLEADSLDLAWADRDSEEATGSSFLEDADRLVVSIPGGPVLHELSTGRRVCRVPQANLEDAAVLAVAVPEFDGILVDTPFWGLALLERRPGPDRHRARGRSEIDRSQGWIRVKQALTELGAHSTPPELRAWIHERESRTEVLGVVDVLLGDDVQGPFHLGRNEFADPLQALASLRAGASEERRSAVEAARRWVELQPGSPVMRIQLGLCLASLGSHEEAVAVMVEAGRECPLSAEEQAALAHSLVALGPHAYLAAGSELLTDPDARRILGTED